MLQWYTHVECVVEYKWAKHLTTLDTNCKCGG
jgi:hypothetical protein